MQQLSCGENDLCLELQCNWATPKSWTEANVPCFEGGANCEKKRRGRGAAGVWVDPSETGIPMAEQVLM